MRRRLRSVVLNLAGVVALALTVFVAGCGADEYVAPVMSQAAVAPDIQLTNSDGSPFRLADQMPPVTLVYFGYTHCPDVCPLTMGNLAAAVRKLPTNVRSEVRVVMVTVDPARDTPEVMGRYVAHFDSSFIGVSGTPAEVEPVLRAWAVPVEREDPDASGSYFVSHPAGVNVLDATGRLRLLITSRMTVDDIAHDLQKLIADQT